jgi:hypothetical protein
MGEIYRYLREQIEDCSISDTEASVLDLAQVFFKLGA